MADTHTICLVDGSGFIFRAFYALPQMTRGDGTPVNAVYGYVNMLMNLIKENACEHIVVVLRYFHFFTMLIVYGLFPLPIPNVNFITHSFFFLY